MNLLRVLVVCALALALLVPAAEAAKQKKKKAITESGVVVAVNEDKDKKGEGTLTVKVTGGKKKNAPANPEGVEKKFTFTKDTKVVKVTGKKKNAVESEASPADLKEMSNVTIVTSADGKVEKISISEGKKKKKS